MADASINDINCLGCGSCAGGMINNIGTPAIGTTACWGSRSCQSVSVLNGTVLYPADLRSYLSLAWANVVVASIIGCHGEASCYNILNATGDHFDCTGFRSCAELQARNFVALRK